MTHHFSIYPSLAFLVTFLMRIMFFPNSRGNKAAANLRRNQFSINNKTNLSNVAMSAFNFKFKLSQVESLFNSD